MKIYTNNKGEREDPFPYFCTHYPPKNNSVAVTIIPMQSHLYGTKLHRNCADPRTTLYYQDLEGPKWPLNPAIPGTVKMSKVMARALLD